MEHLLIGFLYGMVVLVPIFFVMINLTFKFAAPIMDGTEFTKKGGKKMIVNGLGLVTMTVLLVAALWFMTTDTFASVGDALAGS